MAREVAGLGAFVNMPSEGAAFEFKQNLQSELVNLNQDMTQHCCFGSTTRVFSLRPMGREGGIKKGTSAGHNQKGGGRARGLVEIGDSASTHWSFFYA